MIKYFLFGAFVILVLFPSSASSQGLVLQKPAQTLPLEWRGLWLSVDAQNAFKNRFSEIEYGLAGNAVIGYKNYNMRVETILPFSAQGWQYRIKFELQLF